MNVAKRIPVLTPIEYLRIERAAEYRSEYFAGEMFAMSGGSLHHSIIQANILGELHRALKGRDCIAHSSDLRIRVSASGLYTYPDISVICGEHQFDDPRRDTALNPILLVEVLSDSTEAYVRGKKFGHYRKIESLREYLLVSQHEPLMERYLRNPDDTWTLTAVKGLDQSLLLPSIGVTLSSADVFDRVDFTSENVLPS